MGSEIQFCSYCSNLLYPKEDREHKQLIFLCRSCDHLRYADPYSATQNCVDRLNYNFRSKEDVNSYIAQGLGHDPTLPRAPDWKCPKCPQTGAVYFQLPERVADDAMTLVFVCTNCTFYQVKGKEIQDTEKGDTLDVDEVEQGRESMLRSRDDADIAHEETVRLSGLKTRANKVLSPSVGSQDSDYEGQHRREVTKHEAEEDHRGPTTLAGEELLAEDVNYTDDDDDNLDALGLGGSDDEVDRDFDKLEEDNAEDPKECEATNVLHPSEESDSALTQSEVKLPDSEILDQEAPSPLGEEEETEEKVSIYETFVKSP